jgi:ubiquitin-protein ligase
MDGSAGSALLLLKQLREFNRHPVEGISAGLIDESNAFAWNVILVGPSDTLYEGRFVFIYENRIIFIDIQEDSLKHVWIFQKNIQSNHQKW